MKRFALMRLEDVSGLSGEGIVALGVEWDDGKVAMRWVVGDYRSTVVYDDIHAVEAIHGHEGRTMIVPIVDEPACHCNRIGV